MRLILTIFGLLNLFNGRAQEIIKADNLRQSDGKIFIEYQVKEPIVCLNIKFVKVIVKSRNEALNATTISGDISEVKTEKKQIVWDYKADNFFIEGEVDILLYSENCNKYAKDIIKKENITSPIIYPHSLRLKLGVAGIGIGAGAAAFLVRNNFMAKKSKLNALQNTLPQIDGQLLSQNDKDTWDTAYQEVLAAKKPTLFNTLVGIAVAAAGLETYLLLTKRKKTKALSFMPSTKGVEISLTYNF
ncbi:hypothetical protein P1X15_29590 [Runella sp. MFBS21]|uniref:hypothetical protein n=1 Tax=Runella sp. MFBS21 TaxID=3034018 RepID=UPI0023F7CA07|nr:hypothetical protein [Runella sp. MFBS21]MDF7821807.1 hypothetical protein [Runella sp. MFBS21]